MGGLERGHMTTSGHPLTWRPWRERPLFLLAAWLNKHRMPQRLLRVFQFLMLLLSFTADSALSSPELRGQQALSSRGSLPGFGHGRGGLRQTRCRAEKGGDWGKEKGPGREDGAGRPSASGAGLSVIGSGAVKHPPSPHRLLSSFKGTSASRMDTRRQFSHPSLRV